MRRLLSLLISCALLAMAGTASVTPEPAWALVEAAPEAQHRADDPEADPPAAPPPPVPARLAARRAGHGPQPRRCSAGGHHRRPFQPRAPPCTPMPDA